MRNWKDILEEQNKRAIEINTEIRGMIENFDCSQLQCGNCVLCYICNIDD